MIATLVTRSRRHSFKVFLVLLMAASFFLFIGVDFKDIIYIPRHARCSFIDLFGFKSAANLPVITTASSKVKKFVYLTQTESCLPSHWLSKNLLGNDAVCDVFVLSFGKECTEHTEFKHIFYTFDNNWTPCTTWTSGRNWLYEWAKRGDYSYYILFDDDVLLLPGALGTENSYPSEDRLRELAEKVNNSSTSILRDYELFLLYYQPDVSSPNLCIGLHYCSRIYQRQVWPNKCGKKSGTAQLPDIIYTRHFDAAFNAYRSDVAADLLPYDTALDKHSWYESQMGMIVRVAAHKWLMVAYFNMSIANPVHHTYPRVPVRNIKSIFNLLPTAEKHNFAADELKYIQEGNTHAFLHQSAIICREVEPIDPLH